ncbi:alpha/beta hydrolase [Salsuginibacillus kocurii]|uniref:alpha/beta hydrolase n=1 Tax=Salsuginibacillus kocurii TaxID=427078 RepID=UPI000372ECD9|nr:alpha/beta fold hydrolase [Salsuginibacillus kocurii]
MSKYTVIEGADSFYYKGQDIGVLLLHGFIGTPQSVREVGSLLAEFGFTVYAPRLSGHGTDSEELLEVNERTWIENVDHAYHYLAQQCNKVFVVGQSMGGTLALQLAAKSPELAGIITINAAFDLSRMEREIGPLRHAYLAENGPDTFAQDVHEITYQHVPVKGYYHLFSLTKQLPTLLKKIEQPALIVRSRIDHVVPPANSDDIYQRISSVNKTLYTLKKSYHVATMDVEKQELAHRIGTFIAHQAGWGEIPGAKSVVAIS